MNEDPLKNYTDEEINEALEGTSISRKALAKFIAPEEPKSIWGGIDRAAIAAMQNKMNKDILDAIKNGPNTIYATAPNNDPGQIIKFRRNTGLNDDVLDATAYAIKTRIHD